MTQQLRIAPEIFEIFPDTQIGIIICEGINNQGENAAVLQALISAAEQLPAQITGDPGEHPHIAIWREVYRKFGSKPKKYPSSIENLVRRILNGYVPSHINTLVDLYNLISIKHLLPVGGEDLDKTQGDIVLATAGDDELPVRLLGENEERAPHGGEVIYKDDLGAICRRWNWKEADRTKLTEATTRAILVIEALPPITLDQLQIAMNELEQSVKHTTGAATLSAILNHASPVIVIEG
ncbi:MAG TPA: phenylalanine--tRNA ligase beta subunit-related protein [Phototrophicaceae bacterium]|jgi:DNA/RNA-binding domain of Phe-tRNA-synthetase-like protein|nr:phenylalanine--tRNA ligase beta subunit-related protein [Phototrophicaceae bacterium]